MSFNIMGTGSCVPQKIVDNDSLTKIVDTSDEWITTRTGIKERRVCDGETITSLAIRAAKSALENAGKNAQDLDLIICSTIEGEYITPSLACLVQKGIGASCPAFDLNAACSGFLYALEVAASFFDAGRAERILIVSAETMSRFTDWSDRATCVLFGDGAGAVLLEKGDGLLAIELHAMGGEEHLRIPAPTGNSPFVTGSKTARPSYLHMDGQEIYKFAVSNAESNLESVVRKAGLAFKDISLFLLHQANYRIIDAIIRRLREPKEKFPITVNKYGNISSACIPIMLDEINRSGRLRRGDRLALCAFGAGLTTGACVIQWNK